MAKQQNEDRDDEDASKKDRDAEESRTDDQKDDNKSSRGEGPGNLKRRSDWFQKRHGGG